MVLRLIYQSWVSVCWQSKKLLKALCPRRQISSSSSSRRRPTSPLRRRHLIRPRVVSISVASLSSVTMIRLTDATDSPNSMSDVMDQRDEAIQIVLDQTFLDAASLSVVSEQPAASCAACAPRKDPGETCLLSCGSGTNLVLPPKYRLRPPYSLSWTMPWDISHPPSHTTRAKHSPTLLFARQYNSKAMSVGTLRTRTNNVTVAGYHPSTAWACGRRLIELFCTVHTTVGGGGSYHTAEYGPHHGHSRGISRVGAATVEPTPHTDARIEDRDGYLLFWVRIGFGNSC